MGKHEVTDIFEFHTSDPTMIDKLIEGEGDQLGAGQIVHALSMGLPDGQLLVARWKKSGRFGAKRGRSIRTAVDLLFVLRNYQKHGCTDLKFFFEGKPPKWNNYDELFV